MKRTHFVLFFLAITLVAQGCRKENVQKPAPEGSATPEFTIKKLRKFVEDHQQRTRAGLKKSAGVNGVNPSLSEINANDYLLWDLAVREINTITKRHEYLVPIRGNTVDSKIADTINTRGYRVLNFFTVPGRAEIYGAVREYRPDPTWVSVVSSRKNIGIRDHLYEEYRQLLQGEKYNGHILVYSLKNEIKKIITVKEGQVIKQNIY